MQKKILNIILANLIHQNIKRMMSPNQVDFILGLLDWFNIQPSVKRIHYIIILKKNYMFSSTD